MDNHAYVRSEFLPLVPVRNFPSLGAAASFCDLSLVWFPRKVIAILGNAEKLRASCCC